MNSIVTAHFETYASVDAIEGHLKDVRRRRDEAQIEVERLARLLDKRHRQLDAGEWPPTVGAS